MECEDPNVPLTIEGSPIPGRNEYADVPKIVTVAFELDVEFRSWGLKGITAFPRKGVGFTVTPINPVTGEEETPRKIEIADISTVPVKYLSSPASPGQAHASRLLLCFEPTGAFNPSKSELAFSP